MDTCFLSSSPLSLQQCVAAVADSGAGAIATFVGVTRDTFEGKPVVRLEYEAYEPMALAECRALCERVRQRWAVIKVAVAHRTGVVMCGEASVVIAVSSAHRAEALEAVQFAINELKATVPIWKKEVYGEDGYTWKANAEHL